jgi:addiction module HigA family antidote
MRKIKLEDLDDSNGIPLEETNNEDLELFHNIIKEKFNSQSPEEKFRNILISIRFKMEEYLESNNPSKLINVGYFIQEILDSLNIKSKNFAEYLNLKPSNFTSLIKGHRKLNVELALKLGAIFKEIPPQIWVNLQIKNELLKIKKEKSKEFKNYSLKALLKTI